jgi:hypothetical protein
MMFLLLYFLDKSVNSSSLIYAPVVGLLAGLVGLQELGLGFLMATILTITYVSQRKWHSLLLALLAGGICATYVPLYFFYYGGYHANVAGDYLRLVSISQVYIGIATSVFKHGFFIILSTLYLYYTREQWQSYSTVLTVSATVIIIYYFSYDLIFYSTWFSELISIFGQFVLLICILISVREHLPEINKLQINVSFFILLFSSAFAILEVIVAPAWASIPGI